MKNTSITSIIILIFAILQSNQPLKGQVAENKPVTLDTIDSKTENSSSVAPLFSYGTGVGYISHRMTRSPQYLSETEAMDIIANELQKEGFIKN